MGQLLSVGASILLSFLSGLLPRWMGEIDHMEEQNVYSELQVSSTLTLSVCPSCSLQIPWFYYVLFFLIIYIKFPLTSLMPAYFPSELHIYCSCVMSSGTRLADPLVRPNTIKSGVSGVGSGSPLQILTSIHRKVSPKAAPGL